MKKINSLLNSGHKGTRQGGLYDLEPVISKLVVEFHRKSLVVERSLPELPTWAASFPEEDKMLLKYALNNILLETLEPYWKAVSAPDEESGFVVLLQFSERAYEAGTEAAVQEGIVLYKSVARLIQVVGEHLPLTISIGVGHVVRNIQEARESFIKGKEALNLRLYEGYGRSYPNMDCNICVEKDNTADVLPKKQAQDSTMLDDRRIEMIRALESQAPGASAKLMGQWVEELRLHRIDPVQVYLSVHELLEDLLKWCAAQSVTPPDKLADYHWNQILTQDLQDIEALLVNILTNMEEKWNGRRRSKDFVRVQEMIDYMEHHLHVNIGLQEIADHVRMSVSSVSSMFKEETGSTVYDYLTGLRMKKACTLLCETQLKK